MVSEKVIYDSIPRMQRLSLRTLVKFYIKRAQEIESYLSSHPNEWGKFQSAFNMEVNKIFLNIMDFEKNNLLCGNEDKVYKLRKIFVGRIRKIFVRGEYITWSLNKPYGYAGDFKIIDDIYQNNPTTTGFSRLFDNYFQMSAISVAVRNRKEDFKRLILNFIKIRGNKKVRIMDLAAGPCRDIKEIFSFDNSIINRVVFDCYDNDERAIRYAQNLLAGYQNINFIKLNVARFALKKDPFSFIDKKYDLIYATGLFDYFSERLAVATVQNLHKLLLPQGILAISNVRDKYSNPSVYFMEWVGDWNLVYRDDEEFRNVFIKGGFRDDEIETQYEQQGIMQYIIAINKYESI
jgi:SAM-dependent methyltransferase